MQVGAYTYLGQDCFLDYFSASLPQNGAAYDPRPRYKRIYKDDIKEKERLEKVEIPLIERENEEQKDTEAEI